MDPVETIQAIELRHASASSLTDEEWQERLRNWERDQAREREDEDELLVSFRSLTMEQADILAHWGVRRYDAQPDGDRYEWLQFLGRVANFVDGGLRGVYPELRERDLLWPGKMYRGADPTTRDHLIGLIETKAESTKALNDLLFCLAWVGDETVQALFQSWREHPPTWRRQLYIAPETYSVEAGWELMPAGGRRDLFYSASYELIPATGAPDAQSNAVRAALPALVSWS